MKTMIFDLPRELLNEILSRVPLKSMRALRLTCKKWNTLSKSRSFTKMHLGQLTVEAKKEGESQIIVLMDNNLYLMSIVVNENPSTMLLDETKVDTKFVVWNPYCGQTRWIEPEYSGFWFMCPFYTYALGYVNNKNNKSLRSHKILRFCEGLGINCEIYDFNCNFWRALDATLEGLGIWVHGFGLSLKGNTYWYAYKDEHNEGHIICFDFARERFGPLINVPFTREYDDSLILSCVREEKLVALLTRDYLKKSPYAIEVWITTKIDVEEISWSKFLKVDTKPYCSISYGSVFIDEEKKVVIGFDRDNELNHHTISINGETGYLRELDLGGRCEDKKCRSTYVVCSYVPRLVQIK